MPSEIVQCSGEPDAIPSSLQEHFVKQTSHNETLKCNTDSRNLVKLSEIVLKYKWIQNDMKFKMSWKGKQLSDFFVWWILYEMDWCGRQWHLRINIMLTVIGGLQ